MIVVSGCPRSGTSLMMDIFRQSIGINRLVQKSPLLNVKNEIETYIEKKRSPNVQSVNDLNPNGFFEMKWTVSGVKYALENHDLLSNHKGKVVKLVSQGLSNSDPHYIEKVIYMLRPPHNVAKSQERLKRNVELPDGSKIHSVEMYINVNIQAARYFLKNPHIPVQVVLFDELQSKPIETCNMISQFIGENLSKGASRVDPKLNRSKPNYGVKVGNDWKRALTIFEAIKRKDWQSVVDSKKTNFDNEKYFCTRLNSIVSGIFCDRCKSNEDVVANTIQRSNRQGIDWKKEPCVRDCVVDKISIDESIKNNHWIGSDKIKGMGDVIKRATDKMGIKPCNGCEERRKKLNKLIPFKND